MRLAIVDHNRSVREKLRHILDGAMGISVIGSFASGKAALRSQKMISAEAAIVDIMLPDMNGPEFIQKARSQMPHLDILVHTGLDTREHVISALRAGAAGYIIKGSKHTDIVEAVAAMRGGNAPLSPGITSIVVAELREQESGVQHRVTEREKDVLACLVRRMKCRETAKKLKISQHTVRTHIKNIYKKLHTKGRQNAILKAKRMGVI